MNQTAHPNSNSNMIYTIRPINEIQTIINKKIALTVEDSDLASSTNQSNPLEADLLFDTQHINPDLRVCFYECALTVDYLISNKELPLTYGTIIYKNVPLFNIYIVFQPKLPVTQTSILNAQLLDGQFNIKIDIPDKKYVKYFPFAGIYDENNTGNKTMVPILTELISTSLMTELIIDIAVERKQKIKMDFCYDYIIPEPSYNISKLASDYRNNKLDINKF